MLPIRSLRHVTHYSSFLRVKFFWSVNDHDNNENSNENSIHNDEKEIIPTTPIATPIANSIATPIANSIATPIATSTSTFMPCTQERTIPALSLSTPLPQPQLQLQLQLPRQTPLTRDSFHQNMIQWMTRGPLPLSRDQTLQLLHQMRETPCNTTSPTLETFHLLLNFWSKKGSRQYNWESAILCTETLNDIVLQRYETVQPTLQTFNYVLEAWSRCSDNQAPSQVKNVLTWMNKYNITPNATSIRHVIWTWVRSNHSNAEQSIKDILHQHSSIADIDCYNGLLALYAKRPPLNNKAEPLLKQLLQNYQQEQTSIQPDYLSFCTTITACCHIPDPKQAETIYKDMLHHAKTMDLNLERNQGVHLRVFTELLECCCNSQKEGAAQQAQDLLLEMVNSIQSGQLTFLSYKQGVPMDASLSLNAHMFNVVIHAWSNSKDPQRAAYADTIVTKMKDCNIHPTTQTYSSLLECYAHDAQKAHDLLMHLVVTFEQQKHAVSPEVHWFNSVLKAWSQTHGAVALTRSNELFMKMRAFHNQHNYLQPTTETFEYLMTTVAHQRSPAAAEYWMADIMKRHARDPLIAPSTSIFNSLIYSWIWNKNPEIDQVIKVFDIFDEMQESFQCEPDQYTYQFILQCLAKSQYKDRAQRARDFVVEMQRRGIVPTTRTYNEVLAACVSPLDYAHVLRKAIFVVALKTFRRVSNPDEYTFGYFFQAAADMDEDEVVEKVYQLFQKRGFGANQRILEILHQSYPGVLQRRHPEVREKLRLESTIAVQDEKNIREAMENSQEIQSDYQQWQPIRPKPIRRSPNGMPTLPEWPLD